MIKLYTIGFTSKSAEKFFNLLRDSSVKKIVDTRINNVSQLSGFAKGPDLKFFAKEIGGISYELSEEVIAELSHSLMFIKTDSFEVVRVPNERNPEHPKTRLKFTCNDFDYDLPITDPAFLLRHQKNANILSKKEEIYLCLSLGVKFEATNRHYKLVAGIIE